jgi:hypothetical protein
MLCTNSHHLFFLGYRGGTFLRLILIYVTNLLPGLEGNCIKLNGLNTLRLFSALINARVCARILLFEFIL